MDIIVSYQLSEDIKKIKLKEENKIKQDNKSFKTIKVNNCENCGQIITFCICDTYKKKNIK